MTVEQFTALMKMLENIQFNIFMLQITVLSMGVACLFPLWMKR